MSGETAFVLNPANVPYIAGTRRSLPRDGEGCLFLFALGFLSIGSIFFAFVGREWIAWTRLRLEGVDVRAKVTKLEEHLDSEGDSHHANYEFAAEWNGRREVFRGRTQISAKTYKSLREGGPISVRYARSNPELHRAKAGAWQNGWALLAMSAFLLVWAAIPSILLFAAAKEMIDRGRLSRNGRLVAGEVISAAGEADSDGDLQVTVKYRFTSPRGATVEGEAKRQRNDLKGAPLPPPGKAVFVAYASDKLHRML